MSDKTVAQKIGVKPGQRVLAVNAPRGYAALLGGLPAGARLVKDTTGGPVVADLVHLFVKDRAELAREAARALTGVGEGNLLWISYPKKTSGVTTDISRDVGWEPIRAAGWEPVSIVSIDETWAALRFKRSGTIPARAAAKGVGTSRPRTATAAVAPGVAVAVPEDLAAALAGAPEARARFEAMPPSHRKEYVRLVEEARRPETRARRVASAVERLSKG